MGKTSGVLTLSRRFTFVILAIMAAFGLGFCADSAFAGILLPDQIEYSTADLERSIGHDDVRGGVASSGNPSRSYPQNNDSDEEYVLGLLRAPLPPSGSSSSSSSSTSGGAFHISLLLFAFDCMIASGDDASISRLAESRGLSLPDAPGTDLLRPPRG